MISRNYIKLLFFVIVTVAFCSCKKTPKQVEQPKTYGEVEAEFRASLTQNDTITVLQMADSLMQELQRGELDSALSKLYMLTSEGIAPINNEKLNKLKNHFKRFPVIDYKLIYYNFSTNALNDLKYSITFVKDEAQQMPAISFMFNPFKAEGKWYLCVKEERQSSKDMKNPIHPKAPVY